MSTGKSKFSNKKAIRYIVSLVILVLAIRMLLPELNTLKRSLHVLLDMNYWFVAIAIVMQVISYLGIGYLLQQALLLVNLKESVLRSTLIYLGSYSISMVASGAIGGTAAIFRWTKSEKESIGGITVVNILPSITITLMLLIISIFGIIQLIISGTLSKVQIIGFGFSLLLISLIIGSSVFLSRNREKTLAAALWVGDKVAAWRNKPFDPEVTTKVFDKVFLAWDDLRMRKWAFLILGAVINLTFDMLTLYFLFLAADIRMNIGILLSGYALPILLGRLAFIFPGGIGVIESSMATLYTSLGVPNSTAVVVVLAYRFFRFWAPTIFGFMVAAYLEKTLDKQETAPTPE